MSSYKFGIAICTLNQLCLDFKGNLSRILTSIDRAIELGASIRLGPELEITGYGCEDAFYEIDTVFHSWQVLGEILKKNYKNIIICIGMPVIKDSCLYNCVTIIYNSKIVYIRAKNRLAIHGNYRENRYFKPWNDGTNGSISWFELPPLITEICEQKRVPFGDGAIIEIKDNVIENNDLQASLGVFRIGFEICEELWHADTQSNRHFGLRACHLVVNPSSSYWELRKLDNAYNHVRSVTSKTGGVYAYVNNIGCDGGGRLCFYGRSFVMENGNLLSMSNVLSDELFDEVSVTVSAVDPINIQQFRLQNNIPIRSCTVSEKFIKFNDSKPYENSSMLYSNISDVNTITIENCGFFKNWNFEIPQTNIAKNFVGLCPEEEIMRYCSLWLWDYLRRCIPGGIKGFIVPLSGGLDSSSVVCIVYSLCRFLHHQIYSVKNQNVIKSLKSILDIEAHELQPQDICQRLLRCCYLRTKFSGQDSYDRAKNLAQLVGADFQTYDLTDIYQKIIDTVPLGIKPKSTDDVTIQQQNVQARIRMVLTYYMSECNRLVLATGNVDEALVGYLTKYDCSSADLNPIGSISKNDLKRFMIYSKQIIPNSEQVLDHIINAIPSAELTGQDQKDEEDLGLTYDELSLFGRIRRGIYGTYGPYGMFCKIWNDRHADHVRQVFNGQLVEPTLLASKIKRFFTLYARNRHKQTILTPSLHTETYSPDDNRFDHRQFLFNTKWPWQFEQIDKMIEQILNG
ncbi:Glutamine-dependent NAD(+) synthetase [Dermatophagoides farinae]|uniref:Glutamine-dependent NAD(+) synthetase n=1 Tax=Dermatophagoides farinae TaxID=6954 RepID=A0A922L8G1_DERFA|nr:Glutamine-dependent NAD(+) synthetase [Dermatophagoides farinae]